MEALGQVGPSPSKWHVELGGQWEMHWSECSGGFEDLCLPAGQMLLGSGKVGTRRWGWDMPLNCRALPLELGALSWVDLFQTSACPQTPEDGASLAVQTLFPGQLQGSHVSPCLH